MKKICVDCQKEFHCSNNRCIRCPKCQEEYQGGYQRRYQKKYQPEWRENHSDYQPEWRENHSDYQSSYWSLIPTNSHQSVYYQYAKFAKTLSDDEIQVLVLKNMQKLKYAKDYDEIQEIKTYLKILQTEYKSREADRDLERIEGYYEEAEKYEFY
jgi:hypothetical protein